MNIESSSQQSSSNGSNGLRLDLISLNKNDSDTSFLSWYSTESRPAYLATPDVPKGVIYHRVTAEKPQWIAMYDLSTPASKESAPKLDSKLAVLNQRFYLLISSHCSPDFDGSASPVILYVAMEPNVAVLSEAEFHSWYEEEHTPEFSKIPGWGRTRRFKLVESALGNVAKYLAIHEFKSKNFEETKQYQYAASTAWAKSVVSKVNKINHERGIFELRD